MYIYKLYFKNWSCEMPRGSRAHFITDVPRQTSLSLRENRANEERRSVKGSFGRTNAHGVLFETVRRNIAKRNLRSARVIWLWSSSFLRRNRRELSCPKQLVLPCVADEKLIFSLKSNPAEGVVRYKGAGESVPERLCQRVASLTRPRNESWWEFNNVLLIPFFSFFSHKCWIKIWSILDQN